MPTFFGTNTVLSTLSQEMSTTSPGSNATSSPQMGWVVGTGSSNSADMDAGTNVASSAFTGTGPPDGSLVTGTGNNGDHFRSTNKYTGTFASGNWTWHTVVIGVTQSGAHDGRADWRLFRGPNADGTSAVEITSGKQTGSTVTNLSTSQQDSTSSVNPGTVTVTDEYLFVQVAWVRTGAGGMSTTDVALRYGDTGTRLETPALTVSSPGSASFAFNGDGGTGTGINSGDGSSAVAFGATAVGDTAGGVSEAAGTASVAFDAAAAGKSTHAADGSASAVFDAPATGASTAAATGTTSAVFDVLGDGAAIATSGAGTASAVFLGTGTGAATGSAAGEASFAFAGTAVATAIGPEVISRPARRRRVSLDAGSAARYPGLASREFAISFWGPRIKR